MIPSDLRAYQRQNKSTSLIELTAHFGVGTALVENQLAYWRREDNILERTETCGNKGCAAHSAASVVLYQ
jgi:hypothetical protein